MCELGEKYERIKAVIKGRIYSGRVQIGKDRPGLSYRNDGFRPDPPIYYPPGSPPQSTPENTAPGYPFYRPPPIYRLTVPYSSSQQSAAQSASPSAEAGAETEAEVEAEPAEPVPTVKVSSKIHIVGFDTHAKFIAHGLAAIPKLPPVQILTHYPKSMTKWGEEGRAIQIFDTRGFPISTRDIPCPALIHTYQARLRRSPILDNIVVSTVSGAAMPTLARLRPYIDRRTTLCLVQPGLGLMELLNERVFDDPALRPNYVLCQNQHKLSRHSSFTYSLRHVPGHLLLHAVPRDEDEDLDLKMAQALGSQHTEHMINLFSKASDLNAVRLPWHIFLLQNLPDMIFQSVAETISVILGYRYHEVRANSYAMSLWRAMLHETLQIVSLLPEFQDHPWIIDKFTRPSFRRKLRVRLEQNGTEYSRWISMVRKGQMPPVDFINGYFVRRARDVGIDPAQNQLAVDLVKARHVGKIRELQFELPLGLRPYMQDLDRIAPRYHVYNKLETE
ncbi:hypothetical protein GGR52DRAFT_580206 [Hypoxylon sp. FL1284]|nr:hypothetical protein GGR52DRAFT_580206 [Hypoxylon sp. FL1284]